MSLIAERTVTQPKEETALDGLTGCHNHESFKKELDRELAEAKRHRHPLSLAILDLDRFNQLNTSAGRDAGDIALKELARCFREELRGVDSVARLSGDQFALTLPQSFSEGAKLVVERLRLRIALIVVPKFGSLQTSVGLATFPTHGHSRASLVLAAETALANAKLAGQNRVFVADHLPASPDDHFGPFSLKPRSRRGSTRS